MIGTTLSHYKIIEKLGQGGMDEVYLAEDSRLDRKVALKILPEHLSEKAELRERFEREARAVSSLNHPHICTLYDIGEQDGIHYLVMEHLVGETLEARLAKGALPLEQTLEYAIQIADALDKAHRQGVVHRDLKPGNIMLVKSGAKLLDFGLAKLQAADTPTNLSALPTEQANLTAEGTILGTLQYMAPEQLEGKDTDSRTDIFAFGAVVYEMATGKKAFEGKSQASLIGAILKDDPAPMSELKPMTPALLDQVVKQCLEKEADERWQTAGDLMRGLRWVTEVGTQATPATSITVPPLWKRAMPWGIAFVIAVWSLLRLTTITPLDQPTTRLTISFPESEPLALVGSAPLGSARLAFDLSPDGTQLVYVAEVDGDTYLYRRPLGKFEATRIPGTEGAYNPFFSPDGQSVDFFAGGALKKVSLLGGEPVTLAEATNPDGAIWGPNDSIFFSSSQGISIWEISVEGGEPRQLVRGAQFGWYSQLHLLPGGETLLVNDSQAATIRAISVPTGEERVLLQGGVNPKYVSTGHLVYARPGGGLEAVLFDLNRLEVSGTPLPILDGIRTGNVVHYAISTDGTLIYAAGGYEDQGRLVWVDRQGNIEPLPFPPAPYRKFEISPSGQQLAIGTPGLTSDISIFDLESGTSRRLTLEGNNDIPIWTPDGKRVTFNSDRSGNINIYWKMADGSGDVEQLTSNQNTKYPNSWSPDGRTLIFTEVNPVTHMDIWELSTDGDRKAEPLVATNSADELLSLSPDGRWLAYTSDESGEFQIYVRPYPLTEERHQVSTAPGSEEPIWSQSGDEIFYRNGLRWMSSVITTEPEFKWEEPQELFRGNYVNVRGHSYDVAPDGRFLLLQSEQPLTITNLNVVLNWFEELKRLVPTDN